MHRIVHDPKNVSAAWLNEVLHDDPRYPEIESLEATNIGAGQVGQNVRFDLTYVAPTTSAPRAIVGKFPSDSELSRATAVTGGAYLREVNFYQQIAPTLAVQTPEVLFAGIEADESRFCILMEDLSPAVQADQIRGCTLEQAELAVVQAAKMHAPRWGDDSLQQLDWLYQPATAESIEAGAQFMQECFAGFETRYQDRLTADQMQVCRRFVRSYTAWQASYAGPLSLIHCDYRPDNMMFGGTSPLAIVDWQTCTVGAPTYDLAYFLGGGMLPELRRAHEQQLVSLYHETLLKDGIQNYEFADCWRDYRRHAFSGLRMTIHAAMVVERTKRGDDMFMAMASRHAQQVLELDALEFL